MDAEINYLQRDAVTLRGTVDRNRAAMDEGGYTEENYMVFNTAINDLKTKETAQQKAEKEVEDKTAALNALVAITQKTISEVKSAAKSAYGNDARNLNKFNVGASVPKTVKNLVPLCEYMNELIGEKKTDLMKNGLKQTKIDSLISAETELSTLDEAQESAKKISKLRTTERNKAAKTLKDIMSRIRNFAKACFTDSPEILEQFKPIPKGRGGAGGNDEQTPPENTTPPAGK